MGVHAGVSERKPDDLILLSHGSGGVSSHTLVERLVRHISNRTLARMDDSALIETHGRIAFTTDSYTVDPLFFPGGDIGRLAVCGTVNDLAMVGAEPVGLSLALIIEEGLEAHVLDAVMKSVHEACETAGVDIITGDTKVVNRGKADRLFITTSGIGVIRTGVEISGHNARPGDAILINGTVGDHGVAIMGAREGMAFSSRIESDCAPLNGLVSAMLATAPAGAIHVLRDPTRGGLASTLNEVAAQSGVEILIDESSVPVRADVRFACEMLGLDPFHVANEGKLVAIVAPESADKVIEAMRTHPLGESAAFIGEVKAGTPGRVVVRTPMGPSRLLVMMSGELLPRIC
ncbi:MAG: hydrogenase expression/formation protein HypE [Chloroflexota bacterium]